MKNILISLVIILLFSNATYACSMYKITHDEKTIVGNNEDWHNPNTQIWFTPKGNEKYGIMNVGFIDGFAQGAINDGGLMFDGFAMPYLEVKNTKGKTKMSISKMIRHIMHSYASVNDVKAYLAKINLGGFTNSMIVFVDQKGDYLIVEGDELIIGNDAEKSFSNFYPSQTKSLADVNIPFYQNGLKFINSSKATPSVDYCGLVMKNLAQDRATQYSTIYDLENLVVRVYHYQNYENFVEINLKEELQKGAHTLLIPELFPKDTKGYEIYSKYNDAENPTRYIREAWEKDSQGKIGKDLENFKGDFANFLNTIGYEWLNDKGNAKGASAIFEYGTKLFPKNANLYDSYGEALFANKKYNAAIKNYKKSFALNPENSNATQMIEKIQAEQKTKNLISLKSVSTEKELITKTLMKYIEGSTGGKPELLKKAFHPDLNLYYVKKGAFKVWSGTDYIKDTKEGQPTGENGKILSIDFENDAAVAKVEISHPKSETPYIDYFMLLKVEGEWTIIHKMFTKKTSK
ncbi:MAG: nuclear transport factor 2 family protein [Saprospiraceae bacterium]